MQWKAVSSLVVNGKHLKGVHSDENISISRDLFRSLLIAALRHKGVFDENYYLAENSDIVDAVRRGAIVSASEHYYISGYFEGRLPKRFIVDERFYLAHNPDVVSGIRNGLIDSAQSHFDDRGYKEGRPPYADFSLF